MENHHVQWENPLSMVIFNSYVKLSKGMCLKNMTYTQSSGIGIELGGSGIIGGFKDVLFSTRNA